MPRGIILPVGLDAVLDSFLQNGRGTGAFKGWSLCNGQNGTPDLRGRFLVGHDQNASEYSTIGKTGGSKSVTLQVSNIPAHNHYVDLRTSANGMMFYS